MHTIREMPGQVSLWKAVKDFFIGYFDFTGRSTRAGYWWISLFSVLLSGAYIVFLVQTILRTVSAKIGTDFHYVAYVSIAFLILLLIFLIPQLALTVRRCRDAGLKGRAFLVLFVIDMLLAVLLKQHPNTITLIADLLFLILALLPTNSLTIRNRNPLLRFFFREKEAKE